MVLIEMIKLLHVWFEPRMIFNVGKAWTFAWVMLQDLYPYQLSACQDIFVQFTHTLDIKCWAFMLILLGKRYLSFNILLYVSTYPLRSSNGGLPASSSYASTPIAQISTFSSCGLFSIISGGK